MKGQLSLPRLVRVLDYSLVSLLTITLQWAAFDSYLCSSGPWEIMKLLDLDEDLLQLSEVKRKEGPGMAASVLASNLHLLNVSVSYRISIQKE